MRTINDISSYGCTMPCNLLYTRTAVSVPGETDCVPFKAPSHGVISTILSTSTDARGTVKVPTGTGGVERGETKAERENARLKEQLKFQVRFVFCDVKIPYVGQFTIL